jgi:hypothetical protein
MSWTSQVPGSLIVSARSDAHSFDASQMNMSHVVNHLSFGKKIMARAMSDVKNWIPYIGSNHDRLNGRSFINTRDLEGNVTVSFIFYIKKSYNLMQMFTIGICMVDIECWIAYFYGTRFVDHHLQDMLPIA